MTDASGWRPIESAPKNVSILLYAGCAHPDPGPGHEVRAIFTGSYESGVWMVPNPDDSEGGFQDLFGWNPSHWQPLPSPPAADQGERKGEA